MNPAKKAAIAGLAGLSLAGGSVAIAAVSPIGIAGAQDDAPSDEAPTDEAPSDEAPGEGRQGHRWGDRSGDRSEAITEILDGLVADGTITADQRDAIVDAFEEADAERRAEFESRREEFEGQRADQLEALAEVAGVTTDELTEALRDGQSLADISGANVDAVIAYLVDEQTAQINEAVENGRLDQERADEMLADVEERVTDHVNGEGEGRFGRRGPRGRSGFGGGPPGDAPVDDLATSA